MDRLASETGPNGQPRWLAEPDDRATVKNQRAVRNATQPIRLMRELITFLAHVSWAGFHMALRMYFRTIFLELHRQTCLTHSASQPRMSI